MTEQLANLATATLTAPLPIAVAGTSETAHVSTVASFPTEPVFRLNIGSGELVKVTAINGTTLTIERGADGSTPAAHAAGSTVEVVVTKAGLEAFVKQIAVESPVVTPTAVTAIGTTIKDLAGQTANSWVVQDSTGTAHVQVTAATATVAANLVVGKGTLAATATSGFIYSPTIAGAPTGAPAAYAGTVPTVWDQSSNQLWAYNNSGWVGVGATYDIMAPTATGTVATDTANLKTALTATPAGGRLILTGHYKINETLVRSLSIQILGRSFSYEVGNSKSTPTSGPTEISQLKGTMIEMTATGLDLFQFTGVAASLIIRDLGVVFTAGLASTGHGINCTPPVEEAGHEAPGIYGGSLENVMVMGHDGNHYALVRTNVCEFTTRDFRSAGGGGIYDLADSPKYNTGNIVDIHPYIHLYTSGSAHGFATSAATSYPESHGSLNLRTSIRPQCNIDGAAGTTGTQALWKDNVGAGEPIRCLVLAPDLEAPGHNNPVVFGEGSEVVGANTLLGSASQQLENVQYGFRAGAKLSLSGAKDCAVYGWEAGRYNEANATTAIGALSLQQNTTGVSNTAVGYKALNGNSTAEKSVAIGAKSLEVSNATGQVAVGFEAGVKATGAGLAIIGRNVAEALTSGAEWTMVGSKAGKAIVTAKQGVLVGAEANGNADVGKNVAVGYQTSVAELATAIGYKTAATAKGAVAIGVDASGTAASTSTENQFLLGTTNHKLSVPGTLAVTGAVGFNGKAAATAQTTFSAVVTTTPTTGAYGFTLAQAEAIIANSNSMREALRTFGFVA